MTNANHHKKNKTESTSFIVFLSTIFVFVITMTSLIMAFTASFHLTGVSLWMVKGVFGSISLSGITILGLITRTFFDTRSAEIKAKDKRLAKQDKYTYKLSKQKNKLEMIKLQKGVHNG